jgi:hypothetical protein
MSLQGLDIALLGASSISPKTGVPLWEPAVPITDSETDLETLGPTAVYQGLGLTSLPYPKDASGYAECLVVRNVGGRNFCCIGGRDTRTASIVGKMEGGDTVLHSTGPAQAAQLQLKERKRQAALVTKTKSGKTTALILDGELEKVSLLHAGAIFEIDEKGDISIVNAAGSGILIQGEHIHMNGTTVAGNGPPGFAFALIPSQPLVLPTPAVGAPLPLLAAKGMAPAPG